MIAVKDLAYLRYGAPGNKIEHWTDGDLVNDESPVGLVPMTETELWQWAPPLQPEFFQPAVAEEHREPQA